MKKKKELTIKINFSNRFLYTFIVLGILAMVAVGVYAYGTSTPSTFGHSIGEIAPPSPCSSNQILRWNGNALICSDETTPEIQYYSLDISDWNMDSTSTKNALTTLLTEGLTILGAQIVVFDDGSISWDPTAWVSGGDIEAQIGPDFISGGVPVSPYYRIYLSRTTGGQFDSSSFDASTGKRVSVIIAYTN